MKNTLRWFFGTLSLTIILKIFDRITHFEFAPSRLDLAVHWGLVLVIGIYTIHTYMVPLVIPTFKKTLMEENDASTL